MSAAKEHGEEHASGAVHVPHGGGHEEAHEGAPEWLISFADNVTLLMGFFVILFAMNLAAKTSGGSGESSGNATAAEVSPEMLDMAIAIREAFNNPVDPDSSNPIDLPLIRRLIERSGSSKADREGQMGREHDVRSIRPTQYFSPAGTVPFADGSAALDRASEEALGQMVEQLRGHNLVIEIRGHVSAAEASGRPDRGLELSYARARAVAEALAARGVELGQMRLVACADGELLIEQAYEPAQHRENQRVELVVTDNLVQDHVRSQKPAPAPDSPSPSP